MRPESSPSPSSSSGGGGTTTDVNEEHRRRPRSPWRCTKCEETFSVLSKLRAHRKEAHPEMTNLGNKSLKMGDAKDTAWESDQCSCSSISRTCRTSISSSRTEREVEAALGNKSLVIKQHRSDSDKSIKQPTVYQDAVTIVTNATNQCVQGLLADGEFVDEGGERKTISDVDVEDDDDCMIIREAENDSDNCVILDEEKDKILMEHATMKNLNNECSLINWYNAEDIIYMPLLSNESIELDERYSAPLPSNPGDEGMSLDITDLCMDKLKEILNEYGDTAKHEPCGKFGVASPLPFEEWLLEMQDTVARDAGESVKIEGDDGQVEGGAQVEGVLQHNQGALQAEVMENIELVEKEEKEREPYDGVEDKENFYVDDDIMEQCQQVENMDRVK